MAKSKTRKMARRVIPAIRRTGVRATAAVQTTLGDLIAAAFDAVDSVGEVAKVVGSSEMAAATGKKIIFI